MAERRMFSKTIIDSDSFLDLPMSTQALYFHLSMRADDDGFINNPKKIMRMIGASDDDIKLLIAKKFLLTFDSGVVVVKHWRIHNYIQKDRYKPTTYQEEKKMLSIKPNGAYTDKIPAIELDTECIQPVSKMETQVRLGKDRLGKVSIELGKDRLEVGKATTAATPLSLLEDIKGESLTAYESRKLSDLIIGYSTEWVYDALKEMANYGKCQLSYAEAILKRWKSEGRGSKKSDIITNDTDYGEAIYK